MDVAACAVRSVLLLSVPVSTVWFLSFWVISCWTANSGWIDVAWASGVGVLSLVHAGAALLAADWRSPSAAGGIAGDARSSFAYKYAHLGLLTAMITLWALRVAGYVCFRSVAGAPEEKRYRWLRSEWASGRPRFLPSWLVLPAHHNINMLWFFLGQAMLNAFILSMPIVTASCSLEPRTLEKMLMQVWPSGGGYVTNFVEAAGKAMSQLHWFSAAPPKHAVIWGTAGFLRYLLALLGEATADSQLTAFLAQLQAPRQASQATGSRTCRVRGRCHATPTTSLSSSSGFPSLFSVRGTLMGG